MVIVMEEKETIRKELDDVFNLINKNMDKSYKLMEKHPEETEEIVLMWNKYVKKMVAKATKLSEEYGNKKIIKKITKTFIFGR